MSVDDVILLVGANVLADEAVVLATGAGLGFEIEDAGLVGETAVLEVVAVEAAVSVAEAVLAFAVAAVLAFAEVAVLAFAVAVVFAFAEAAVLAFAAEAVLAFAEWSKL